MSTPKPSIIVALVALAFAQSARAAEPRFDIRSDYQLMVLDRDALPFQAHENLFEPSPKLQAIDKIFQDIRASTVRSFIPVAGRLFEGGSLGQADILNLSMGVTRLLGRSVQEVLRKHQVADSAIFPLEHQLFLVPWQKARSDLFYGANKLTVQVPQAVDLLSVSTHQSRFQKDLTFAIQRKLAQLNRDGTDPVMLGGFRSRVRLDPKGPAGSVLEVHALMGLRERSIPFSDVNEMVRIRLITIPTPPNQATLYDRNVALHARPSTVSLTIRQPLPIDGPLPDPTLEIEFGEFAGFDEQTRVVMRADNRHKAVPKFESDVNYKIFGRDDLLRWIAVQFNFTQINMQLTHNPKLENPKFTDMDILSSVGINFKGKQYVGGKFWFDRVDKEFEKAFQANLDLYMARARENLDQKYGPFQGAALKILGYTAPGGTLP